LNHNFSRFNLDPEEKHPSEGSLRVEINAKRIIDLLPSSTVERTRDCIQINYRGEKGIVILVTPESIELRLPTVEWTMGVYGPATSSKFWKRINVYETTDEELDILLKDALKERQNEFKTCRYCMKSFPPEHRINENVCHGCAERYLGVVF
jgi:hypothetical protein